MNFHPTNDNRRDPFDVLCDMVAGEMQDDLAPAPSSLLGVVGSPARREELENCRVHNLHGSATVNADQQGRRGNRQSGGTDRERCPGAAVGVTAGETASTTDLRRHHHEMIARLAAAQPPRIDRSDSLDADGLQTLAEHMQEIGNAYCAYAMQVVREFAQHSAIDRKEVEGYMNGAFEDAIGAMFNAVEDAREWGRE